MQLEDVDILHDFKVKPTSILQREITSDSLEKPIFGGKLYFKRKIL